MGLFVLRLVFLVWSLDAQAGLGAWEWVGVGSEERSRGPWQRHVAEERDQAWVRGHPWSHLAITVLSLPALTRGQVGELHPEPGGSPTWASRRGICSESICLHPRAWLQAREGTHGVVSMRLLQSEAQGKEKVPSDHPAWFLAPSAFLGEA